MDNISPTVYRRFVLGSQGLWPGWRYTGKDGAAQAIHTAQAIQVDPVAVVAQSHDIALWGRVKEYRQQYSQELVYAERKFFDYHHTLMIYPIEDFPFWYRRMQWLRQSAFMQDYFEANRTLLERVRDEIRAQGPLRTRDIQGNRVNKYRSTKDSGVAMFYLWLTGELTIHSRKGRDRVYDFTEKLIPKRWLRMASETETDEFFLRKGLKLYGMVTRREFTNILRSLNDDVAVDAQQAQAKLKALLASGELRCVELEGRRERLYYLAEKQTMLEELNTGSIPADWTPLDTTNEEEVVFLAPLERVSARGRAKGIFDFDYTWEIYKPAHTRQYGPYTLPVLYGDRLVARLDSKLDRQNSTMILNGLWLEEGFKADEAFALAFARGLGNFAQFLEAKTIEIGNLKPTELRKVVKRHLKSGGIEVI